MNFAKKKKKKKENDYSWENCPIPTGANNAIFERFRSTLLAIETLSLLPTFRKLFAKRVRATVKLAIIFQKLCSSC